MVATEGHAIGAVNSILAWHVGLQVRGSCKKNWCGNLVTELLENR